MRVAYYQQYDRELPVILVTGTAGKSSTTLMLNKLFKNAGYKVFSGTSINRNFNSIIGLGMVLLSKIDETSQIGSLRWKVSFMANLLWHARFGLWTSLQPKSILIYEVGYDHGGESQEFEEVFGKVELLITTSLSTEHAAGFDPIFDEKLYQKLKPFLPSQLIKIFETKKVDGILANTALEQLTFLPRAQQSILPLDIGLITNKMAFGENGEFAVQSFEVGRGPSLELVVDARTLDSQYLLPRTMAKNARILELAAAQFGIDKNKVTSTLSKFDLPAGRFNRFKGIGNTTIIDSSYNSDPASLVGFLDLLIEVISWQKDNLENLNSVVPPSHTLILGEMRELGSISKVSHQQILDQIIEIQKIFPEQVETVVLLGTQWLECDSDKIIKQEGKTRIIRYGGKQWSVFGKASDINETLNPDSIRPHCWFWIKGSQNTIFLEIVVEHLLADPLDINKLTRRGNDWNRIRSNY